jgi:hypothetical protein
VKRILVMFALVASMLTGLVIASPDAFACTGTAVSCPHGRYDMYGPDKYPTGFTYYYSFGNNFSSHSLWVDRAQDTAKEYDNVTNSNPNFHINNPSNQFLPYGGVNWRSAVFGNICSPSEFHWSDIPGANIVIAMDQNFLDEGGNGNTLGLTNMENCGGVRRAVIVINNQGKDWNVSDAYNAQFDWDLEGVMVHEFGHAAGFGQSGGSNCNDFWCQYEGGGPGEWPGSLSGNVNVPCDEGIPSQGFLDTMCPVIWNYADSYARRSLNHNDIQEYHEAYG